MAPIADALAAARVMYDAVRAVRRGDGAAVGDGLAAWESTLEARVEAALAPGRAVPPGLAPGSAPMRSVLLGTKRALYDVAVEGLIAGLALELPDASAVLDALRGVYNGMLDDWEVLEMETRTVAKAAEQAALAAVRAQTQSESATAELLHAAGRLEADLKAEAKKRAAAEASAAALAEEVAALSAQLDAESLARSATLSEAGQPLVANQVLIADDEPAPSAEDGQAAPADDAREPLLMPSPSLTPVFTTPTGTPAKLGSKATTTPIAPSPAGLTPALERMKVASRLAAAEGVRLLTHKQLRDTIDEVFVSKAKSDERAAKARTSRETLGQHLFTYLNTKFGLRSLVLEQAASILASTEVYAASDAIVLMFGKALRNEVDEEFHMVQRQLAETVVELLRTCLRTKTSTAAGVERQVMARVNGYVADDEYLDIVRYMYAHDDSVAVLQQLKELTVYEAAPAVTGKTPEKEGRPRSARGRSPGMAPPSSPAPRPASARSGSVRFQHFLQAVLFRNLECHERALQPLLEAVARAEPTGRGVLNEAQFRAVCLELAPTMQPQAVDALLDTLDPHGTGRVTVSTCMSVLSNQLSHLVQAGGGTAMQRPGKLTLSAALPPQSPPPSAPEP